MRSNKKHENDRERYDDNVKSDETNDTENALLANSSDDSTHGTLNKVNYYANEHNPEN